MKRTIGYWKYFSIGDFFALLFGLFLDTFHKRIPRKVFLRKNVLDYLSQRHARIQKFNDEIESELNAMRFFLRTKGSDFEVFDQLVMQGGLEKTIDLAKTLKKKDIHIVDCGANIGLATILFKKNFPDAKIISIEPEKSNYAQLCKNIELNGYTNIKPLEMGVWYEEGVLSADVDFRDGANWSFALKTSGKESDQKIPVNSLQGIVKQQGWESIDVLKIDIEGSEFALFRNLDKWKSILDTVSIISLEVHEEIGSPFEIAELLWRNGFKLHIHGELLIGIRNPV